MELGDFRKVIIRIEFTYQNSAVMKHLQTRNFIHFCGIGDKWFYLILGWEMSLCISVWDPQMGLRKNKDSFCILVFSLLFIYNLFQ